jgi:GTPase SAR1 family protein
MKLGVIIIFYNNASDINSKVFIHNLKSTNRVQWCLVDNESKDNTLEKLKEIKESVANISVVEIKKHINQDAAKRAGSRFIFNNSNLKHIGFIDVNDLTARQFNINEVIEKLQNDAEHIIEYNKELKRLQTIKPTLFKSVFSILDYLRQNTLNIKNDVKRISIN